MWQRYSESEKTFLDGNVVVLKIKRMIAMKFWISKSESDSKTLHAQLSYGRRLLTAYTHISLLDRNLCHISIFFCFYWKNTIKIVKFTEKWLWRILKWLNLSLICKFVNLCSLANILPWLMYIFTIITTNIYSKYILNFKTDHKNTN